MEPIDRSIDPYRTLGVRKDCSREELKDAFRAKAQVLHPDRGGAPAAFIELREAFDQVCRELDKRPTTPIVQPRKRPAGSDRARGQPDPDWDPDLIVRDEPLPRIRPARRRDPDWQPEVILLDEPNPSGRPQTRDAGSSSQEYVGWLRRLAARSQRPLAPTEAPGWTGSGFLAILIVTAITLWICWAAWRSNDEPKRAAVTPKLDFPSLPE